MGLATAFTSPSFKNRLLDSGKRSLIRSKVGVALGLVMLAAVASIPPAQADNTATNTGSPFDQARQQYIKRIEANNLTGDADTDFAAFLIPQHQSGVELARIEMDHGHNAMLKKIASNILAHSDRAKPVHSSVPPLAGDNMARGTIYQILAGADQDATDAFSITPAGNIDEQFAWLMDQHHQRAISYAKVEASYGQDDALVKLANNMLKGQQAEHAQMQKLLEKAGKADQRIENQHQSLSVDYQGATEQP